MIRKVTFIILTLSLSLGLSAQGQWKAEDVWVTDIATVEFDRGEIYYVFDMHNHSFMMPFVWYDSICRFKDSSFPERRRFENRYLNLDYLVECFEVEGSDRYDKIQFIKAATLELIWSIDFVNLVSDKAINSLKLLL